MKKFVELILATITGDSDKAKAIKIQKQASHRLKQHLAALDAEKMTREDNIETAIENITKAQINNGELIDNHNEYIQGIIDANKALVKAKQDLENHNYTVKVLKEAQKIVNS